MVPAAIKESGPVSFAREAWKEFTGDDVSGLAAELSYRWFLALFPFLIFLTAMGGFVADIANVKDPTAEIMDLVGDALPEDGRSVIEGQLQEVTANRSVGLLSFGILGAVWAASGGVTALIKAMNRAYDVPETRPLWKRYLISVSLTILAGGFLIVALVVFLGTQMYGREIAGWFGSGLMYEIAIAVLRWPVVLALLLAAMAFVYWVCPNLELKFKWVTPGALGFAVAWLVASAGFGFYVANFSSYNATYGALGGVVVLLVWLYLTSVVMIVGAEINAMIDRRIDPAGIEEKRQRVVLAAGGRDPRMAKDDTADHDRPTDKPVVAPDGTLAAANARRDHGARATALPVEVDGERADGRSRENGHRSPAGALGLAAALAVTALAVKRVTRA